MPDVSVIVPVYNIKTLLPRCVASLQAQTWQDFEVWLVDDGSTDGSGELCDEYAVKDARIQRCTKKTAAKGRPGTLASTTQGVSTSAMWTRTTKYCRTFWKTPSAPPGRPTPTWWSMATTSGFSIRTAAPAA